MTIFAIATVLTAVFGLPIAALVIALRNLQAVSTLRQRLDDVDDELSRLGIADRLSSPAAAQPSVEEPVVDAPAEGFGPPVTAQPEPAAEPRHRMGPVVPVPAGPAVDTARLGRRLEEQLGAHLPIWIGAIALTLAGAFLVKLSLDRGWLDPPVRVALGALFGLSLLGTSEFLKSRTARVAAGLAASGVAVLFVSLYAGVSLYALIPPLLGFGLLAMTTAAAVALSLRHGAVMAVLGLLGGFVTPHLVRLGDPDPKLLFFYLLLLQGGLLIVSRKRGWWQLALSAFLAGLGWVGLHLAGGPVEQPQVLGGYILAAVALPVAAVLLAARSGRADPFDHHAAPILAVATSGGFVALAGLSVQADHSPMTWAFLGLLSAGSLVLARLRPSLHSIAWAAAGVPALLALDWQMRLDAAEVPAFLLSLLAIAALLALGSYLCLWRSPLAGRWAWLSTGSAVTFLLLAHRGATVAATSLPWSAICLVLATLYLAAALPVASRRSTSGMESALAALATAVTVFVSLAAPMELEREWLTVAWAVEAAVLVWLAGRLRVATLDRLALALGAMVGIRLLLNPALPSYPVGNHLVFNWLTYGYGIPVAAFAAAARLAAERRKSRLAVAFRTAALALGAVGATLLVRQGFHPGEPWTHEFLLAERGAVVSLWLAGGWALLGAYRRWRLRDLARLGEGLVLLGLTAAVFGQGVLGNPLWHPVAVGQTPVVNWLLLAFGLPAALLLRIAHQPGRLAWLAGLDRVAALWLCFLLITLEVRQAFHGAYLNAGAASGLEQYAYSAAWALFGLALLALGIRGADRGARYASLSVMFLAVGKVFLYDMAELRDFHRILSFLGLGVSLMLLAWLYQRFVFRAAGSNDEAA